MWIEQVVDREGQPTGESRYHVVNQVRVRLRDLSKTGEVLQKVLEAGDNNTGRDSGRLRHHRVDQMNGGALENDPN